MFDIISPTQLYIHKAFHFIYELLYIIVYFSQFSKDLILMNFEFLCFP